MCIVVCCIRVCGMWLHHNPHLRSTGTSRGTLCDTTHRSRSPSSTSVFTAMASAPAARHRWARDATSREVEPGLRLTSAISTPRPDRAAAYVLRGWVGKGIVYQAYGTTLQCCAHTSIFSPSLNGSLSGCSLECVHQVGLHQNRSHIIPHGGIEC